MRRRAISLASVVLAVVALVLVLYNATLVDRRAPTVTGISLSAPAGGDPALAQTVTAIDVEFSEAVDRASVERRFRIEPSVGGSFSWDGTTLIFSPTTKLPQDTAFLVSVESGFQDVAGNVATAGLEGWTFRTVGSPQVVTTDPVDGATGVPQDAAIVISFDRLMDTSAVEAAISLEPAADLRAVWSGQALTLTPDAPLAYGTEYILTVGTAASDTDGNQLRAPYQARFTTVAAGLGVRTAIPADGVAGIGVRTAIAVVFDGPVEPSTVDGALQITPPVNGTIQLESEASDARPRPAPTDPSADANVLIFRPSQPLAAHTTYTVTLAPVVEPLGSPGEVAAGRTWTFTTGQPPVSGQNQIAFLSARSGVRNVWLMNPDGSNARQLTTELVPVTGYDVTPDGSTVAWSTAGAVNVMRTDGSNQRLLTPTDRFEYGPRFSPDGRWLVVGRRDGEGMDLGYWLVPLDAVTGNERQVLASGAPPLGSTGLAGEGIEAGHGVPAWAGRTAFRADGAGLTITTADGAVWLVDLADPDPPGTAVETGLEATGPAIWDAGAFLVVGTVGGEPAEGLYRLLPDSSIRLADATGTVAATSRGAVVVLRVGPDGVAHVAAAPDGETEPRLQTDDDDLADRWPTFAPDGRTVLFGRVRTSSPTTSAGIWLVDSVTGTLTQLSTDGAYPRWLP
jgi:hypothetical protein